MKSAPTPAVEIGQAVVYHGDCVDVLAALPDASVDAVVTDPPYGLEFMGKDWDAPWKDERTDKRGVVNPAEWGGQQDAPGRGNPYSRSRIRTAAAHYGGDAAAVGRSFQQWCEQWAAECLRVLKPGGHLLAFGGDRTYHRLTCAVEDAGFEIRGSVLWIYGSGFPKSLDVSKAIDKMNGRSLDVRYRLARHIREKREAAGYSRADMASWFPQYSEVTANWERCDEHGNRVPTVADWAVLREWIDVSDEWLPLVERVEAERKIIGTRTDVATRIYDSNLGPKLPERIDVTAPATDEARRWDGWGTALKPAHEPIVVARKPLAGTVAQNVLAHGTGGLNIDACRVAPTGESRVRMGEASQETRYTDRGGTNFAPLPGVRGGDPAGRWPANVALTHHPDCDETCDPSCPVAELDRQSGTLTSGANPTRRGADRGRSAYGQFGGQAECDAPRGVDVGGASRFFPAFRYQAKASAAERPTPPGASAHPTVKPLELVRWLVRLVTPPGGTVLDPFLGSGTTAEACLLEGFACVGVEREAEYLEHVRARLGRRVDPQAYLSSTGQAEGTLFEAG